MWLFFFFMYKGPCVAVTKRKEVELQVAEPNMVRFSLGVTRMDRIREGMRRAKGEVYGCVVEGHVGDWHRAII